MSDIAILQAFEGLPDPRRAQGRRHSVPVCLALFTLAVAIGGFPAERFSDWPEAKTIIRVERNRILRKRVEFETVYYISDLEESAGEFARRIRDYWKVENCVHYVRDVTFGEDRSRTRTGYLPILWAITRDLAINLYRSAGFTNMARAKRFCGYALKHLLALFRMK